MILSFRKMRIAKYEELVAINSAQAGKTFRRSGKHVRAARRCQRRADKLRAKDNPTL